MVRRKWVEQNPNLSRALSVLSFCNLMSSIHQYLNHWPCIYFSSIHSFRALKSYPLIAIFNHSSFVDKCTLFTYYWLFCAGLSFNCCWSDGYWTTLLKVLFNFTHSNKYKPVNRKMQIHFVSFFQLFIVSFIRWVSFARKTLTDVRIY